MDTTPPPLSPEPLPPTPPPSGGPTVAQWKLFLHLSGLVGIIVPVGNILAPLAIWLIKKPELPALDAEGRKVLNFQISYTIYILAGTLIASALSCLIVPFLLPLAAAIAWLVFTIIGSIKTSNGVDYQYPLTIKML